MNSVLKWALNRCLADLCELAVQRHAPVEVLVELLNEQHKKAAVRHFRRASRLQLLQFD